MYFIRAAVSWLNDPALGLAAATALPENDNFFLTPMTKWKQRAFVGAAIEQHL